MRETTLERREPAQKTHIRIMHSKLRKRRRMRIRIAKKQYSLTNFDPAAQVVKTPRFPVNGDDNILSSYQLRRA